MSAARWRAGRSWIAARNAKPVASVLRAWASGVAREWSAMSSKSMLPSWLLRSVSGNGWSQAKSLGATLSAVGRMCRSGRRRIVSTRSVGGDAMEPGAQGGVSLELLAGPPCFDEGVLCVFGNGDGVDAGHQSD